MVSNSVFWEYLKVSIFMLVIGGLFPAGRIWSLFCLNTSVTLTHPPSLPPSQYRRNIIFRKDLSSATAVIFSAVWSLMFVSCCLYFLVARVTAVLALAVWWLQCQGQCGCQSLQSLQSLQTARGSIRRQTSADSRTNTNITSYILARLSLSLSPLLSDKSQDCQCPGHLPCHWLPNHAS